MGPGAAVGQWDDAGKSFGAFVTGKETDILFDVGAECYALGLKVEWAGYRVNGEDINRNIFQVAIIEHHVGQHVTTYGAPAPAHKIDLGRNYPILAERLDDLFL
ncbi:hypothetical protein D3C85_1567600 [compost metagenome]